MARSALEAQRQESILAAIEKQKEFASKKKLASAAAGLGVQGLTEAKLDVIYKDATDADGPTEPQTKQLWEAAGLTGIKPETKEPVKKEPGSTLDPEKRKILDALWKD